MSLCLYEWMEAAWIVTCLGLMFLPGPDMALVSKYSLRGSRQGWQVLGGIYLSFAIYSLAILGGIIPLLSSWPQFFVVARVLGGLYLIYLGWTGLQAARSNKEVIAKDSQNRSLWRAGFISNALNAKQYLFLFLLLPSFLPESATWLDSLYLLLILLVVSLLFWTVWIAVIARIGKAGAHHHRRIETVSSLALLVVGALLLLGVI